MPEGLTHKKCTGTSATCLPLGWCVVQSLGWFDTRKSGHLVLWDLKLIVEFPASALILFPLATIVHSLFQYVDYRCRTTDMRLF
ncbi:hypothetical protein B0H14DRAFT_2386480 [Mycena olivaceomarginata]|nr:hypothetical protein B0H14DRAFT_2386480 [Mycena olivaceomarginata]